MYKVSAMFSSALLALTSLCEPVVFAPKPYVDKQFAAATNAAISYVEGKGYVTSNDLSSVATSGDYNDLSNKPSIPVVPSGISGFANDSGYVTESVTNGLASKGDLSNATNELAKAIPVVPYVPTKVSELTNDSGYITHEEDGTFLAWKTNQILVAGESASAHSNPDYGSVALGKGANAKGSYSVAVGNNAKATMNYTTAVGNSSEATGFWSVAYGGDSEATYKYATAVGYSARGAGENAVAVGHSSRATMDSVAVGNAAQSSVKYGIAIGSGAQAAGDYGIAIGYKSYALKSCFSIPFGPESFYFSSSATNGGQTAKSLKGYLDEKASVALLNSYSNELSTAISNARPDDYENVSNRAANAASRSEMTSATNTLATSIEASGTDLQLVRGKKEDGYWDITVGSARQADTAGTASLASNVYWANVTGKPTTLSGYGITDAVASNEFADKETDPKFNTWTNASSVTLGNAAKKGTTNGTTVGCYATAGTINSTAVGAFSKAGYCSSAFGYGATAAGGYSLALGYDSYAPNDSSMGLTFTPEQIYLGAKKPSTAGRTLQSYFDEFVTANDVDAKIAWTNSSKVAVGYDSIAAAGNAVAVGSGARARTGYSVAIGMADSSGATAVSIGYGASSSGKLSVALLGSASQENSVAIGENSRAVALGATALGAGTYVDDKYSVGFYPYPGHVYFGARYSDRGASARTLQSYLDERATTNSLVEVSKKVDEVYNAGFVTESVTNGLASVELLNEHVNDKVNPHGVSAAQIGALTNEASFIAYTNGASVALCNGARAAGSESAAIGRNSTANGYYSIAAGNGAKSSGFRSSAFGTQAEAGGGRSTALGYLAYAKFDDTVAIPFDASHFYLNSSTSDKGASGYSLQSMFDAVASNITFTIMPQIEKKSNRYVIETLDGTDVVAQDAHIYSITAGTNGFTVVTPDVDATYSQDFVIRVHVADANGTQIARLEDYLYDFPSGDLTETASIVEDGYVKFTQVTKGRWLVCWIPAKPQEQTLEEETK